MPTPEQQRKIKQLERTCKTQAIISGDVDRVAKITGYFQEASDILVIIPESGRYIIGSQGNIKLMLP